MGKKIVWAGTVITEASEPTKTNFGVVVDGNQIIDVGAKDDLINRHNDAVQIGGDHYFLLPAMVDSHDHGRTLGTSAFGVSDDILEAWVLGLGVQPQVDPYLSAALDGLRLIRSGVSTVTHYHNPNRWMDIVGEGAATIRGYRDAGLRVIFCPPYIDQNFLVYDDEGLFLANLPAELRKIAQPLTKPKVPGLELYQDIFLELYNRYHDPEQHLVTLQTNPVGGQWCSDESMNSLKELALKHKTRVQMHLLETRYQKVYAERKWGKSFVQHLEEIDFLGPWLTLAHMVYVEIEDLSLLAKHSVGIASNPSANLRLRSGIAPLAKMREAGITIGIGLDGHCLDDDQDYFREMRLAWVLGNLPGLKSPGLSPRDTLEFGTSGGAAITLGADVPVGKLIPGYLADLVLLDFEAVKGLWFENRVDTVETLLCHGRHEHVRYVMVHGEWVFKEGLSCRLNEESVKVEVRKAIESQQARGLLSSAQEIEKLTPYVRSHYLRWDNDD